MLHDPMNSKQAKHQRPQLISYKAMKKKMIRQLPTPCARITPIDNNNLLFLKVIYTCNDQVKQGGKNKKRTEGAKFHSRRV